MPCHMAVSRAAIKKRSRQSRQTAGKKRLRQAFAARKTPRGPHAAQGEGLA